MAYRQEWLDRRAPAMGRQPLRPVTGNSELGRRSPMLPATYDPPTVPLDERGAAQAPPMYFVGATLLVLTVMLLDCLLAVSTVYVLFATLALGAA